MNAAVVFFSLDGNSRMLAGEICDELGADSIEITVPRKRRVVGELRDFVWGTREIRMTETPEIRMREYDFASADLIVIGTPVWSGSMAPAIRSFLASREFFRQTFAVYACYSGRCGGAIHHVKDALIGNDVIGELPIRDPLQQDRETIRRDVRAWARSLVDALNERDNREAAGA